MRWSGARRLREAGGCIDRGMGGMRRGCVAGEGWPRVAGPALGCSERQCASKGSEAPEAVGGRPATSQPHPLRPQPISCCTATPSTGASRSCACAACR
jgi:hypothetical protein